MLFRKMLRDMGLNKTQFISIFIMTILGVVIYAGVSSEWNGLDSTVKQYYSETNFPNAWVYSTGFSEEAEKAVSKEEGITGAERRLSVDGTADLKNKPSVKLHFVKDYKLATFKLIEGEDFSEDKDGIWLDQLFAGARGLKVGDKIKITFQGITLEKVIKGLVISPEYVYYAGDDEVIPVRANNGYGFLSYKAFPK
jgi:putative ABC transport system permease protein